jgi:hypothetical protein
MLSRLDFPDDGPADLTKKIRISRSAAADLCGGVLDWSRDSWWFRAWSGLYA